MWEVTSPTQNDTFSRSSNVPGNGSGEGAGTDVTARVKINSIVENTKQGEIDNNMSWAITVDNPDGAAQWTCSDEAVFEIAVGSSVKDFNIFKVNDSSCPM